MSKKRTVLIEAALVVSVLATGIAAAEAAHAAPILTAALQAAANPAARADVKIDSAVMVERAEKDASGNDVTKTYSPKDVKVIPGDKLLFVNSYRNTGAIPATGFVVNNPVHPAVSFTSVDESWAVVSVDGGKTFGKLVDLTVTAEVKTGEGEEGEALQETRAAQPSDVTNIRWVFAKPIAARASGKLQFRGVVK